MGNVCIASGERLWREIRYSDNMPYHLDYIEGIRTQNRKLSATKSWNLLPLENE